MRNREFDLVKWAIWAVILGGLVWGVFFANQGLQAVFDGIHSGTILMLGAIGLTLTYKILNFANFSHGDILLFGAYIAFSVDWLLTGWLPQLIPALADDVFALQWTAIVIAMAVGVFGAVGLSLLIDRVLYRRMRRSAAVVLVIASFGMALFVRNLVQAIWGTGNRRYDMLVSIPRGYGFGDIDFNGSFEFFDLGTRQLDALLRNPEFQHAFALKLNLMDLVTLVTAFSLAVLLHVFLKYTRTGKAMRAMSDNPDLARVSGINTERMIGWTWAIGAGLAALAGVFMGLNFAVIEPNMGAKTLLPMFAAVILGGIGSPYGAMLGAVVIGVAQTLLVAPVTSISSQYKPGIAFVLMIVMLLVRPQGLLGEAERKG